MQMHSVCALIRMNSLEAGNIHEWAHLWDLRSSISPKDNGNGESWSLFEKVTVMMKWLYSVYNRMEQMLQAWRPSGYVLGITCAWDHYHLAQMMAVE